MRRLYISADRLHKRTETAPLSQGTPSKKVPRRSKNPALAETRQVTALTHAQMTAKPPPGFSPIHRSIKGGFHKQVGGKFVYWYPGQGQIGSPHEADRGKVRSGTGDAPPVVDLAKVAIKDYGRRAVTEGFHEVLRESAPEIDRQLKSAAAELADHPAVKAKAEAVKPTSKTAVRDALALKDALASDRRVRAAAWAGLNTPQRKKGLIDAVSSAIARVSQRRAEKKADAREAARAADGKSKTKAIARTILSAAAGPFLFGFIDNFMLYLAGASIDKALASAGITAAAVAGLGNAVSDTVGQRYSDQLEGLMDRIGLGAESTKGMLPEKQEKKIRAWASQAGIFAGCLAGMVPLAFGIKFGKSTGQPDMIKAGEKPPPGFIPIPGSKHGGYHRKVGGSYVYWYPGSGLSRQPKSADRGKATKKNPKLTVPRRRRSSSNISQDDAAEHDKKRIAEGKKWVHDTAAKRAKAQEKEEKKKTITDPADLPEGFNDLPKQKRATMTAKWDVVEQEMQERFGEPRKYEGKLTAAMDGHVDDMVRQGYIAKGNADRAKKMLGTMAQYGTDAGVPGDKLASLMEENVRKLAHQEVESLSRTLGDHGVRHLSVNAEQSDKILDQLKRGGVQVSPMDHFMAAQVWIDHDMGYAIPAIARGGFAVKDDYHPQASALLSLHQKDKFEGVFGKAGFNRYARAVANHSNSNVDWKGDYFGSAVRLADNTHLFSDKMPEVLFDTNASVEAMVKIRLADELVPKSDKDEDGKPKRNAQEKARFKALLGDVKSALTDQIKGRDDLAENTRAYLLKAAQEVGALTPKFLISRLAGRSPKFDFDGRDMNVVIEQSAARETIGQVFGEDETDKQFHKLLKDYGTSAEKALGAKPPPPHARIGDPGNGIDFQWTSGGTADPAERRHASVMKRTRAEFDKIKGLKGAERDKALGKFFGAKLAKALAALEGMRMDKSITPDLDQWLAKTMVSKQGKEHHFADIEAKVRASGGADDPAAVAAKVYRASGGVPDKTTRSSKKLKRQKKQRAEKRAEKSLRTFMVGHCRYTVGDDTAADRLEKGEYQVDGQAAYTLAGPAMKRGELPCLAPEQEEKLQQEVLDQTVTVDLTGWGGSGGLAEWWDNAIQTAEKNDINVPHKASNVLRHYVEHPIVVVASDPQLQATGKASQGW